MLEMDGFFETWEDVLFKFLDFFRLFFKVLDILLGKVLLRCAWFGLASRLSAPIPSLGALLEFERRSRVEKEALAVCIASFLSSFSKLK